MIFDALSYAAIGHGIWTVLPLLVVAAITAVFAAGNHGVMPEPCNVGKFPTSPVRAPRGTVTTYRRHPGPYDWSTE